MIPLKYATASQEVPLGFFLDSSDGDTEETGLTISNTDIWLWKAGATTLANKNSGGATHMQNGVYYCTLDATDTDTYGPLVIFVHESGALTVRVECVVMNADAYDALYAADGTGHIEADAVQISGDGTAADNLETACDNYSATRGLAGTALPAAAADAAGGLPVSDAGGLDMDAILVDTNELQTDDVPGLIAALNDPTAAAIRTEIDSNSTQLAAIVADTNELQTDDVPGLIAALNDISAQDVTDDLLAEVIESSKSFKTMLLDIWAVIVGNASANDADNPTSITYDSPDDSVQRTHTLTSTSRSQS